MLTREMLNFTRRNGRIYPRFADTADSGELDLSGRLLSIFNEAAAGHLDRGTVQEMIGTLPPPPRALTKLQAGLVKLMEDDAVFAVAGEIDHQARRRLVLESASRNLAAAAGDYDSYLHLVAEDCGGGFDLSQDDLYGDLPEHETLLYCRHSRTPEELLNRYNVALLQSLVIYAGKLKISFADCDNAALRRLLRVVRFHRLIAAGTGKNDSGGWQLEISGPFALFGSGRKYALQLASFLPAILLLPEWKLTAELELPSGGGRLEVDHRCGIAPLHRDFGGFIPEEIRIFGAEFKKKDSGWELVADVPLLPAGESGFSVPDFSFRHHRGKTVHLELFHRWHQGGLKSRIDYLKNHPEFPLILGVDRALEDEEGIDALCGAEEAVKEKIFLFRDFPGAESVRRILKTFVPAEKKG